MHSLHHRSAASSSSCQRAGTAGQGRPAGRFHPSRAPFHSGPAYAPASGRILDHAGFPGRGRCQLAVCHAARTCHYQVLGLKQTATSTEIKAAFRRLALKLHPDVNPEATATEQFRACKDAYEVLSDPASRARYDMEKQQQARVQSNWTASSSSSRAASGRGRRGRGGSSSYYTVYNVNGMEFIVEEEAAPEEEEDLAGTEGFWAWHQSGSWQSSWQANRKKQQRRQAEQQQQQQSQRQGQQQQQQRQQQQARSEREELDDVLQQLDPDTIAGLKQVFGSRLQHLQSKEELLDFLGIVSELMEDEGLEFGMFSSTPEPPRNSSRRGTTARGSSSRAARGGRRATSSSRSSRSGSRSRAGASGRPRQRGRSTSDDEEDDLAFAAGFASSSSGLHTIYSFGDLEELLEMVDLEDMEGMAAAEDAPARGFRDRSAYSHVRGGIYPGCDDEVIIL